MKQALVVSDDRHYLGRLLEILMSLRWQTRSVTSLEDASKNLEAQESPIVVADLEMSGGKGFELIATARRASHSSQIIAVTRGDNQELWEKVAHVCGADKYLVGPVSRGDLLAVIGEGVTNA